MIENSFKNEKAFTLVEIMIVVAITGMLASIAIPSYQGFIARARQSEAKASLPGMYAAEMSYFAESGHFTGCVKLAGYSPSGTVRYYFTGEMGQPWACPPGQSNNCDAASWNPYVVCDDTCGTYDSTGVNDCGFGPTTKTSSNAVLVNTCNNQSTAGIPLNWEVFPFSFVLGAAGNIIDKGVYDMWQIDNNGVIKNIQNGL